MTTQLKSSPSRFRLQSVLATCITLISISVCGCGSTQELSSSWSSDPVTIDGDASEWGSGLTNIKDTKVYIGVRNDRDFVYVCLTSTDQAFRRQLIGAGLSVWFENPAGVKIGVRYPIGMAGQQLQPVPDESSEAGEGDRERFGQQFLQDLEVLGPGEKDRNLFSVVQVRGISVKLDGTQHTSAYELRVPLQTSPEHPYAVGATPGALLKVSLATGKFERPQRSSGGEEMDGRGMGRGRGMSNGGRRPGGGMPERGMERRPEPLDVTLKIHLAAPDK